MIWFLLTRRTGEAGSSDLGTTPIYVSSEAIQFFQAYGAGTRIYLRSGAIDSVDVTEKFDEIMSKGVRWQEPAENAG